jgi:hypothetical protein
VEHEVSSRRLKGGEIRASCSCGKWSVAGRRQDAVDKQIQLHERKSK